MLYAYMALAAVQAIGGFQQADIIRSNGELQTNIDDMNASFANYNAYQANAAGLSRAAQYADVVDSTNAADRAAFASSGVTIGYGTAGEVTANNTVAGMVNSLQLQKQGQQSAMGYETQGINLKLAGSMAGYQADLQADSTQAQGLMSAASTGLAGYAMSQSTGPGQAGKSGTSNDQGGWSQMMNSVNMSVAGKFFGLSGADSVAPPSSNASSFYGQTSLVGNNASFASETQ